MKWIPKFRFSLRTLFVVTTLLGAGLVPLVVRLERARQQKEAVAWVLEHGGVVYYEGGPELSPTKDITLTQQATDPFSSSTSNPAPVPPPTPPNVSWLEGLLGTDFFYPVTKLELRYCEETDISPIGQFSQLRKLDLRGAEITDYEPLAKLKSLREIDLSGSGISDLSPLSEIENLMRINIADTNVKDLRPLANLSQLCSIDLIGTAATDLSPLANNSMLDDLSLATMNLPTLSTPTQGSKTLELKGDSDDDVLNSIVIESEKCNVDFSPLFQLENLKRLYISVPKGADVDQLKNAAPKCERVYIVPIGGANVLEVE